MILLQKSEHLYHKQLTLIGYMYIVDIRTLTKT